MPKALIADWNLAMTLYVEGVGYRAIAERVGVTEAALRQRAHRHCWHALGTAALQTASHAVTRHNGRTQVERSVEVRSGLADEMVEVCGRAAANAAQA